MHARFARVRAVPAWIAAAALGGLLAACADDAPSAGAAAADPDAVAAGEELYAMHCAACHGAEGEGTPQGPPLVHEIYNPAHHPDESFQLAIRRGVAAHHWGFGPMPPIPAVTDEQVEQIVDYVRALQVEAGIE